jgi:hypothetical protein
VSCAIRPTGEKLAALAVPRLKEKPIAFALQQPGEGRHRRDQAIGEPGVEGCREERGGQGRAAAPVGPAHDHEQAGPAQRQRQRIGVIQGRPLHDLREGQQGQPAGGRRDAVAGDGVQGQADEERGQERADQRDGAAIPERRAEEPREGRLNQLEERRITGQREGRPAQASAIDGFTARQAQHLIEDRALAVFQGEGERQRDQSVADELVDRQPKLAEQHEQRNDCDGPEPCEIESLAHRAPFIVRDTA